jgi:hypothetical protein
MEHMLNVVGQQGGEEGVSVLVEQEAGEEQREEVGVCHNDKDARGF